MYSHDVLIIGAGLAGMRAALSARQNGADVAVISKVHPSEVIPTPHKGALTPLSNTPATTGEITPMTRSRDPTTSETRTPSKSCAERPDRK